ncbi:unnamed protein product [Pelagomonas calceolata]|uniref:Uncharacterized protein n=1 Tax=Pelagomonas calceolata TaxID=35677 RepID=A0A8J2WUR7_9STRA|nr:unnamed protein product [Pelagomonas calceolata]
MEDTVPPAAAQAIITASNLLNDEQQCHKAAAHFTQAFRLAPQLATAFAEEFAEAADALATHRSQNKGSEEAWRAVVGAYLTCINACPANALLLTRLGVAAHARGKLVEARAAFVKAATLDDAVAAEAARREVLRLNRSDVTLHCAESTRYGTDIRYDVVVAEVVDAALFGEGCLATLADVSKRLAHDTTKIIPRRAALYAVAVQSPELRSRYAAGAARAREPYTVCDLDATPHTKLATLDLGELDLVSVALQGRRETVLGEAEAVVMQGGRLEGFAVYFELRDGDARLTTAPALYAGNTPRAVSWTQALFHVDAAPVVKAGDVLRLRASVAPDGGIDVLRLAYGINDAPSQATAAVSDDAPSADDVERANDGVYAAAHARAVQKAVAETNAPVCECGLFAGSTPTPGQVVVSHAPVEASGLLRPAAFDLPLARAVRVVPRAATCVGRLVASPSLRRAYFCDEALGFDVKPLNAFASPIARDVDPRAFSDLTYLTATGMVRRVDFVTGADPAAVPEACSLDVATTGVADALLYWWRLGYDAESLSTRPDLDGGGPLSHWRCAACVLRPGLSVSDGDTVRIACAVRFGCLEVLSAEVLSSE